jgi:anaerobic ribonucleoside-triphosphate reductase activating protein
MVFYDKYDIVFQEIPDEVSLAFTIKGCPNMCEGCHSPHLRETTGNELTEDVLGEILNKYQGQITCVLFLGGDAYIEDIIQLSYLIHRNGLKVAMYSGRNKSDEYLARFLDYYKIGSYNSELGGLDNPNTNQRLYTRTKTYENAWQTEDITYKLRR